MSVKYLKDGADFDSSHFGKDFGFSGSAEPSSMPRQSGSTSGSARKKGPDIKDKVDTAESNQGEMQGYAKGGHAHPHGHKVVDVEHQEDGTVVMHHEHGGMTLHHPDGEVSHHDHMGKEMHARGGMQHEGAASTVHTHPHGNDVSHVEALRDGGEIHHHAHGGMTMHHADGRITHHDEHGAALGHMKPMIDREVTRGIHQHEEHDHRGEKETDMKLRRGGEVEHHAQGGIHASKSRIPRTMMPAGARNHSPINSAPRNPGKIPTARNMSPGGSPMGYGVEPSAEPDSAGADMGGLGGGTGGAGDTSGMDNGPASGMGGTPQFSRGGRKRR